MHTVNPRLFPEQIDYIVYHAGSTVLFFAQSWPLIDEKTASSLCYTSRTTANPKGRYSHCSMVLHSFVACQADGLKLSSADTTLLAVPLFHVNAWGIPYTSAMCGATVVLPGSQLDGRSL